MRQYIALIHKDVDSDYGVSFPDLPGVISAGKTLDEARDMGAEALALHLEGLAADGEAAPEPSSLEEIMTDAQNKDGVAVLIAAPATEVKSIRINVTMPADVLDQIDRYAERSARIEFDDQMRLHLHGERNVRQMRDAGEFRRHLGVIGLDEVGHVALAELARFQHHGELF